MNIILYNTWWMSYNIALALIGVIFGWLTYKSESKTIKIICGIIWILFLPNTIYILTDIFHLFEFWNQVSGFTYHFIEILQYMILMTAGILTFIFGLYPLEKMLKKPKSKKKHLPVSFWIISMNILIAFAMVLGRVERANSWDVVFNIKKFVYDSLNVIHSPMLVTLFIFFGILCNTVYFSLRKLVAKSWNDRR